ncbi:MAG: glycosyltransferase family 2 protein [Waddliaceae bacterium]
MEVISGAFMFARRTTLLDVEMFDENFFLYSEDIDLCKRVREFGWKIWLLPGTPVIHYQGQSLKTVFSPVSVERYQGEFYYYRKHHGSVAIFFLRLILFVSLGFRCVSLVFRYLSRGTNSQMLLDLKKELFSYLSVIRMSIRA